MVFMVAFGTTIISGIASVLLSSVGCHPSYMLFGQEDLLCSANVSRHRGAYVVHLMTNLQAARWIVVCVLDIITEIVLIAVPAILVSKVQMHTSKKRTVFLIYFFRIG